MAKKDVEARRRKNRRAENKAKAEALAAQCPPVTPEKLEALPIEGTEKKPLTLRERLARRKARQGGQRASWRTKGWVRGLLCALAPLVLLYACQLITLQTPTAVWAWFATCPAVALTYGALLGVLALLFAVTTSLLGSTTLVALPVLVFAFANHMKEALNGAPVMISDLALAGSPGELLGFLRPGIDIGSGTWGALALTLGLLALIAVFGCRQKKSPNRRRIRLVVAVLGLLLAAFCLASPTAKQMLAGQGDEIQAERNDRLGLLAGFYSGWLNSAVTQPNAYHEDRMNTILRAAQRAKVTAPPLDEGVQPNVIMLMSESFCDPTVVLPGVDFKEDPIPNYRRLTQSFPGGPFLSNTYAGGTGNVEMEVMTGMPIAFLGSAEDLTALRDRTAYDRIPSVVKAFGYGGYATEFIHSYNDRLYQRAENLPAVGFDEVLFDKAFPKNAEMAGGYLSDMALTEKLISEYQRRDKSKPLFLFGLSMENHQPYFGEKFDGPSGLKYSCDTLDENALQTLDNLLQGLHHADAALGALLDYFETRDEPTIVVFWGDHLPGLNVGYGGDTLYSLLGYVEDDESKDWDDTTMKRMHTTQYLVWNNYGADFAAPAEMSTLGLGTNVLDWAGVEKPLYYHWVDAALEDMLLYRQRLFVTGDGTPLPEPPAGNAVARDYRNLVYDMVYGRGYITGEMTRNPREE